MKIWPARLSSLCVWLWLISWLLTGLTTSIQAETWGVNTGESLSTNPKNRSVSVTATMPDVVLPSTPILIAPENNALLRINQPMFSWYGSTDNVALSYYQIWKDGVLWLDSLPLIDNSTASYTLTYLASENIYQLIPKIAVTDGQHTWKVVVFDTSANFNESATWLFTVDTQSPVIVVTQIGETAVTVSSQDATTIPQNPIELTDNEPILKGTGEAGAQVRLMVIIPDQNNLSYTFTIGTSGTWQVDLPLLPRDIAISLDFIITDPAGNVGVLSGLKFIIVTPTIVLPVVQVTPDQPVFLPPSIIERLPSVTIPLLSPRELLFQTGRRIMELLPAGIQSFLMASFLPISILFDHQPWLPNLLALLVLILPAITGTLLLAKQFGLGISPSGLMEIWRGLGLWPDFHPQGLVIDSRTGQGLGFASLKLTGNNSRQEQITQIKITNQAGVYDRFGLEEGEYRITVKQKNYSFPSLVKRLAPLNWFDWYQGGSFKLDKNNIELGLVMPLDVQADLSPRAIARQKRRDSWLKLASLSGPLTSGHFAVCLGMTIIWPSVWNAVAIGIYTLSFFRQLIRNQTQTLAGQVVDHQQIGLPWVSLIWQTSVGQVIDALITDQTGHFQSGRSQPISSSLRVIKPAFWLADADTANQQNVYNLTAPLKTQESLQIKLTNHA